jgi:hypothetical protein
MWVSIMRPYYDFNSVSNPLDNLYEDGTKTLIDVCVDKLNDQIIVLARFSRRNGNSEFQVEIYTFSEDKNEMSLVRIFNVSQILAAHLNSHETFDFVRIYYDHADNSFVILDTNNHKLYWCNTFNFQVTFLRSSFPN